ncbi:MAG: hypothetical protein IJ817_00255 [Clostridia bacterium]|nr:hypothetical protein [Clostridia bacterium]
MNDLKPINVSVGVSADGNGSHEANTYEDKYTGTYYVETEEYLTLPPNVLGGCPCCGENGKMHPIGQNRLQCRYCDQIMVEAPEKKSPETPLRHSAGCPCCGERRFKENEDGTVSCGVCDMVLNKGDEKDYQAVLQKMMGQQSALLQRFNELIEKLERDKNDLSLSPEQRQLAADQLTDTKKYLEKEQQRLEQFKNGPHIVVAPRDCRAITTTPATAEQCIEIYQQQHPNEVLTEEKRAEILSRHCLEVQMKEHPERYDAEEIHLTDEQIKEIVEKSIQEDIRRLQEEQAKENQNENGTEAFTTEEKPVQTATQNPVTQQPVHEETGQVLTMGL